MRQRKAVSINNKDRKDAVCVFSTNNRLKTGRNYSFHCFHLYEAFDSILSGLLFAVLLVLFTTISYVNQ